MTIKSGDPIPDVKLSKVTESGFEPVQTGEAAKGKTIALFAVPGAFTPTCSARHLPGFVDKLDAFKAKGVDVACLAVNDPFVMSAWAKEHDALGKITMLADGNGDFTRAVGLEMDGSAHGLGKRSQRYSMLIRDGVVEKLNVEQPGEFKVSAAEYILDQI